MSRKIGVWKQLIISDMAKYNNRIKYIRCEACDEECIPIRVATSKIVLCTVCEINYIKFCKAEKKIKLLDYARG